MGIVERHSVLAGLKVRDAMRRQIVVVEDSDTISKAISTLLKYKINAALVQDEAGNPRAVVSKTDIMTAYYGGLPLEQEVSTIATASPITCTETEALEKAMAMMRENGIYRLYVRDAQKGQIVGLLAYPDIVGLLYRLCRNCSRNYLLRQGADQELERVRRFKVKEIMHSGVESYQVSDDLYTLMEGLSQYRFGAVLIRDEAGSPAGVVSKTDLILAYKHGVSPKARAGEIMSRTVHGCEADSYLAEAIQKMIFSDIHRLFVYQGQPTNIVGVLSFTDAARVRSGSCRACLTTRIKIEDQAL